jgi:hypothetical protein
MYLLSVPRIYKVVDTCILPSYPQDCYSGVTKNTVEKSLVTGRYFTKDTKDTCVARVSVYK